MILAGSTRYSRSQLKGGGTALAIGLPLHRGLTLTPVLAREPPPLATAGKAHTFPLPRGYKGRGREEEGGER